MDVQTFVILEISFHYSVWLCEVSSQPHFEVPNCQKDWTKSMMIKKKKKVNYVCLLMERKYGGGEACLFDSYSLRPRFTKWVLKPRKPKQELHTTKINIFCSVLPKRKWQCLFSSTVNMVYICHSHWNSFNKQCEFKRRSKLIHHIPSHLVVSTEVFSEIRISYYESALKFWQSPASDCLICSLEMSLDSLFLLLGWCWRMLS